MTTVVALVAFLLIAAVVVAQRMADPTATLSRDWKPYEGYSKAKVVSAEALTYGGLVAEIYGNGEIQFLADEANAWPTGVVLGPEFGTSLTGTALDTEADVGVSVRGEIILRGLTVSGATAYAKKGLPVFGTDGQTLTLTRPSDDAIPCGYVWDMVRDHTGATAIDIYLFGKHSAWMFSILGGCKRRISLATVELADIADTNTISHTLWGHGLIKEIGLQPWKPASTASKASTLTGNIGGVAITTGAISATTAGLATAGTAQKVNPTAANEFHDGDVFTLVASSTTAFVEGSAIVYLDVEYLPGA